MQYDPLASQDYCAILRFDQINLPRVIRGDLRYVILAVARITKRAQMDWLKPPVKDRYLPNSIFALLPPNSSRITAFVTSAITWFIVSSWANALREGREMTNSQHPTDICIIDSAQALSTKIFLSSNTSTLLSIKYLLQHNLSGQSNPNQLNHTSHRK